MNGDCKWKWIWRTPDDEAKAKSGDWKIGASAEKFKDVGILADGTLHNPNNYPEDILRAALNRAAIRLHEWRSKSAKLAAVTRKKRVERKTYEVAQRFIATGRFEGPRHHCYICGKGLNDRESITRGVGSECWQKVLEIITAARADAKSP